MLQSGNILSVSIGRPVMVEDFTLVKELTHPTASEIHYHIQHYQASPKMAIDDTGMLIYNYNRADADEQFIELRFCIERNTQKTPTGSLPKGQNLVLFHCRFDKKYLSRFISTTNNTSKTDKVIAFEHPSSFSKTVPVCGRTRVVLDNILNHHFTGAMEGIFMNVQLHTALLCTLECLVTDKPEGFDCKFLDRETDRNKIVLAREVLLKNLEEQMTIKQLSQQVGINECYLKKGFKKMFGTTIFEFYQTQRMEHARYLLHEKGLTVTEVAYYLGYSSISHFSTAFRKHTGLKPCELLWKG